MELFPVHKKSKPKLAFFRTGNRGLQSYDVLGLWAFLALYYGELNFLAFGQGFETRAGDGAEMCEHIWAGRLGDETETFGFVEPFDGSGYFI